MIDLNDMGNLDLPVRYLPAAEYFIQKIQEHTDPKDPVNGEKIARGIALSLGEEFTDEDVRKVVAACRAVKFTVLSRSSSDGGYWYSEDPDEIADCIKRLRKRIENQMKAIDGLEAALREIQGGQEALNI